MTYTVIPNTDKDAESIIDENLITLLRDNPIAIAAGDTGAPKIVTAAITDSNVTLSKMAASSVDTSQLVAASVTQSKLSTTTGEISTTTVGVNVILPGGEYSFYPQTKSSLGLISTEVTAQMSLPDGTVSSTSYISNIYLGCEGGATATAQARYIQASPPYNLGDGDIPLFIFCQVDSSGKVITVYQAPEAPWHYNGPTNIKADRYGLDGKSYKTMKDSVSIESSIKAAGLPAGTTLKSAKELSAKAHADYIDAFTSTDNIEIEITQSLKNNDIAVVPSPMGKKSGMTVVMLDPVSDFMIKMSEMREHAGFSINELLHDGDLVVDNSALNRSGPPGVDIVSFKFR